jgi:membrane protease YdiL (CAAX protease family)
METRLSDKPHPRAAIAWSAVVVGLALAVGWIEVAQRWGASIPFDSPGTAMTEFYALVFGPLIVLAIGLGLVCRTNVFARGRSPARWALAGLACGAGGFQMTHGFSRLNGGLVPAQAAASSGGLIALGVALTLFQAAAEELLFRGWLQPVIVERIGAAGGIVLTAVLFGAFHMLGGTGGAISLVNLALGGLWFGLLAWRSGGVLAPLMAHFAWNAIEDLGFGLVPNPGAGPLGAWSDHDLVGSTLWGGVQDGLNASIGTTCVLVALILPLLQPAANGRTAAAAPA